MCTVEFNPDELEVLRDILAQQLRLLDLEIFRTDTQEYRKVLKHRKELLQRLLGKCTEIPVGSI